jgi:hypothetical protein
VLTCGLFLSHLHIREIKQHCQSSRFSFATLMSASGPQPPCSAMGVSHVLGAEALGGGLQTENPYIPSG